jgi:predicted transcriptional regulator
METTKERTSVEPRAGGPASSFASAQYDPSASTEGLISSRRRGGPGANSTALAKEALLAQLREDGATVEFDSHTGLAKIDGETTYISAPTRRPTIRQSIMSDMASSGIQGAEIARQLGVGAAHVNKSLKDPKIRAIVKENLGDTFDIAKQVLKSSIVTAAENIKVAVTGGDLKMSQYVLATQGIAEKKEIHSTVEVAIRSFGACMELASGAQDIHEIEQEEITYTPSPEAITDVTQLPKPSEGERL